MELSARTRHILEAPVLSTLLTLAAPNLAEVVARITFNTVDAVFVSWTGPDGLAAVAVVFPILLIVHSCTAAGFGFGVSSSISRALGADNPEGAARLAGTAVMLAILGAIFTTTVMLIAGPMLYAFLGVSGKALELATTYSLVLFGGVIFVWLMNILANISRGSGIMTVAAFGVFFGEIAHVSLSPILILGWGPIPSLGVVGAAIGVLTAYALGATLIGSYFLFGHPVVRIQLQHLRIRLTAS
jgi:Na+-driven multidrug efflux pump